MSGNKHNVSKGRGARPTIGYLAPAIHGGSLAQWIGVVDAAQKHDVNLICFPGWSPNYPSGFLAQANVLYDLVTAENVDGVVTWASTIGNYMTFEELQAFHERYRPLPIVSIGRTLADIPNLLMDSYEGMREAIVHLIEVHGVRRLAFIRGPEGHFYAQERYRAYTETLKAYGIPLDPNLVTPPNLWGTGREAMQVLLDERKLRPQTDFEAVAAANDELVLSAWDVLQERGGRVPGDMAAVGFDDRLEGRTRTPPLTSVAAPFYEVGYQAVETLLALMEGKQVPGEVTVPSRLVVRQSCGCLGPAVAQAAAGQRPAAGPAKAGQDKLEATLAARREEILTGMMQTVEVIGGNLDPAGAERLLDGFAAELGGGSPGAFLTSLSEVMSQVAAAAGDAAGSSIAAVQNAVSTLRRSLLSYLDGEPLSQAEDLWQQARVMIGERAQRAQVYEALQAERQAGVLREVGQALLTTFDVEGLMDVLAEGLPRLNMPSAYLSLYEDPEKPTEWSRLMLAYSEEGRLGLAADGLRFPSPQLLPEGMWPRERRYCFVVSSLYFQDNQLGFVLCEVGPREGAVYDTLSTQISNALQGALLVQRVRERSAELTRQQYILDTFMETVPDRVYFKDIESRITRANKAHATKLGLGDPAEEIGKSDFDFFLEEQAQAKYEQEQEIIHTGQPLLNVEEVDGEGNWSLTTKMPLRDEHGEIIGTFGISRDITEMKQAQAALEQAYAEVERQVRERTAELEREIEERERAQEESVRLQQEVIDAQRRAIQELSTPIIPILEGVIVMPLIGSIDTLRAREVTRHLLAGIREHHARVVILDITGVPIVDSGVASYLNKTIQAARLKGAWTVVTGISDAVAETIVDLGIDWSDIETLSDLQTGLRAALSMMNRRAGR